MTDPGALRARVELIAPSRDENEIGGADIDFVSVGVVWARIAAAGAGSGNGYGGSVSRAAYDIDIRMRRDVRPGWRLVWEERALRVVGIVDADAAGVMLRLSCEEEFL